MTRMLSLTLFKGLLAVVVMGLFVFANQAAADEDHYNNILIGDRPAGMGGAYTAISDDASGLYYNPAGIVHAIGSGISGSMNAYHITKTTYKNALGGQTDWTRKSSNFLPNFFGLFQNLGKSKIGFSYAILDSIRENQDQRFFNLTETPNAIDEYVINFNNQEDVYNLGVSFATELSSNFSWGITLYAHSRNRERILHQYIDFNDSSGGDFEQSTNYFSVDEQGVRPVLGLIWSPWNKISLGLNFNKTFLTSYEETSQVTMKEQGDSAITRVETTSNEKRDLPLNVRGGIAYFPDEKLLLSTDLSYHESYGFRDSVLNFAIGTEYYLNPSWALRGGFYSNYANTPKLENQGLQAGAQQLEHVDLYGISFSFTRFSSNSSLSLGLNYSAGSGTAQLFPADDNGNALLQDTEMSSFTLFISATSSY
ncbi:OmpP1/FadL family transporter [Kaarinaea lacus]